MGIIRNVKKRAKLCYMLTVQKILHSLGKIKSSITTFVHFQQHFPTLPAMWFLSHTHTHTADYDGTAI